MKLKLIVAAFLMLSSAGCMTTTDSYSRDIVYRDGSYYSPADEEYGDYYYQPEPDYYDYDSYDHNSYYYGNSWYSRRDASRCRFSYHYDRYCDNRRGNGFVQFGGLTLIFGNSNYYGSGYGYPYYGSYPYYTGYPYYGGYRPQPYERGPIPMSKPRPVNQTPDYSVNNAPGMRVSGEAVWLPTKPGLVEQNPDEPVRVRQDRSNRNPYTRIRQARPTIQPEIWRNQNDESSYIERDDPRQARPLYRDENPRVRTKPALLIDDNAYEVSQSQDRQNHRTQPYPRDNNAAQDNQAMPVINYSTAAPPPQENFRQLERQERAEPRNEVREPSEPVQRNERPVRGARQLSQDEADGGR